MTFKECNILKTLLMHPKEISSHNCARNVMDPWICPEENCNSSYIGESSRCLESRIKEHDTSAIRAIFHHNSTHNHSKVDISQFTIIDQNRKQVSREAMHIRWNKPALNCNIDKMNIPRIFNQILGITNNTRTDIFTNPNIPQNPSTSSSSRATRAKYLLNELVLPHYNNFSHISNAVVHSLL